MLTQIEVRFYESVQSTLHNIDKNLERIATALEKQTAGTKEEGTEVAEATEKQAEHKVREYDYTDLSARVRNVFDVYNIRTPEQAAQFSRDAFLRVRALGDKSVKEIEAMLKKHGLRFGDKQRLQRTIDL